MSTTTNCPRCGSNRLTSQQDENDFLCRTCKHRWAIIQPASLYEEDEYDNGAPGQMEWRNRFYKAYERGDMVEAERLLDQSPYRLTEFKESPQAYRAMKREDLISSVIRYTIWGILGFLGLKLILYMNR